MEAIQRITPVANAVVTDDGYAGRVGTEPASEPACAARPCGDRGLVPGVRELSFAVQIPMG